jgi:hypothetical protein
MNLELFLKPLRFTLVRVDLILQKYFTKIGTRGGLANTPKQQAARAANGKKGGRPKAVKRETVH